VTAEPTPPEEQLAWEAGQRTRAAIAGILAGVLLLAGGIWSSSALGGSPTAEYLDSLLRLPAPGSIGADPSLLTSSFEFGKDREVSLIGSAALRSLGFLALAYAITFLAVATRARRPEMARAFVYVPLVAAVLLAVESALRAFAFASLIDRFLDGPRTVASLEDLRGTVGVAAEILQYLGTFGLAVGLVVVSLNAMRAGLLTRFMGYLGIITGFLMVLVSPLIPALPLWLIALGVLFSGRWPRGAPPAWRTGRAEPWPSQQEVARARRAARSGPEPATDGPPPAAATPRSSQRRKRKRRT
jgi:hypothetical protein